MQSKWYHALLLGGAIFIFTLAVSAVGFWKYAHYRYGGMDLAIYTNVLSNLSGEGEKKTISPLPTWYSSIQGSSYLGDHVEPVLLFLIPFFRLWPDPRLLLILQAFALGLTAVPVYFLLQLALDRVSDRLSPPAPPPHAMGKWGEGEHIPVRVENGAMGWQNNFPPSPPRGEGGEGGRGAIVLTIFWLLNPLMWNAALFEFHALAFALLFLLSAAYCYLRRRLSWFLLWLLLSLCVREDVALIAVMFGAIALIDWWRKQRRSEAPTARDVARPHESAEASCQLPEAQCGEPCRVAAANCRRGIPHASEAQRPTPERPVRRAAPERKLTRSAVWVITPLLLGLAWFFLATRIAAAHSPSGAYKFLVYYGWLMDVVHHPLVLLRHFLSIGNLDMALGLLLPFLLLPTLPFVEWVARRRRSPSQPIQRTDQKNTIVENWSIRGAWLLLALPPLLQILLAEPGGSNVVVELHYGLLFLPALTLASIEAIAAWKLSGEHSNASNAGFECLECTPRYSEHSDRIRSIRMFLQRRFPLPKPFAIGLGIATYLATAWMLGPFPGIANAAIRGASANERTRAVAYDELLTRVPSDAPIAAGYAALPHIAARAYAYALPYAYLGVNQYAFASYVLPEDLRYLILDQRDALAYAVQFPSVRWSAPYAAEGPQRLRAFIERGKLGIVAERDGVVLLERDAATVTSDGIDRQYFESSQPVRGRLIIDPLRDIVVQLDR